MTSRLSPGLVLLLAVFHTGDALACAGCRNPSLPTAKASAGPLPWHQHIQFGTGTFDPVLGVDASKRWDEWTLSWFALGRAALYENRHGFRAPFRVQSELQGTLDVGPAVSLGTGVFHEAAERWQGVIRQDGSLGRTEWYASVGLGFNWLDLGWMLAARVPLYRDIVAGDEPVGEFSSPVAAQIGVERTWDL